MGKSGENRISVRDKIVKPNGILSFNGHHMKEENVIISRITERGLFRLLRKVKGVSNFLKEEL